MNTRKSPPPPPPGAKSQFSKPGIQPIGAGGKSPQPNFGKSSVVQRPPLLPFAVIVLLLLIEIGLMQISKLEIGPHLSGATLGMFASVIVLGWFRQALNNRRSTGSFSEWGGPLESTKAMWTLVVTSWLVGTWHLFVAMYELLRP
jgi:hypothetical protein